MVAKEKRMVKITINGIEYEAPEGVKILNFCHEKGIEIPSLCHLKDYSDIGSCRLCMVEIEGYHSMLAACRTKIEEGMVITTNSEKLTEYRKEMLRLLLSNHTVDCMNCPKNG